MLEAQEIALRYKQLRESIDEACVRAGRRPDDVTLVAVSKTHPVEAIVAALDVGCLDFGENRVQEWREKAPQLSRRVRWHFIGPLQSNKVKYLVDEVALVHSIDSERLVVAFEKRASAPQDVLIEVNIGEEPQKAGVAPDDVEALVLRCASSPIVRAAGLMCIPPHFDRAEDSRPFYRRMRELLSKVRETLRERDTFLAEQFCHLSMGMTHDYIVAVEEGATILRVGTAIFGQRAVRAA